MLRAALAALPFLAAAAQAPADDGLETAIFAGGCFWCVEADFDKVAGVVETVSGYAGGETENPTYKQVVAGGTGHRETVRIVYDPAQVSYERLVEIFFRTVDPLDAEGQFCDRGESYATAIFATGPEQRETAEAEKRAAEEELGAGIVTPIETGATFWPAESYHQDYYEKNPLRYRYYRWGCGRDARIEEIWGAPPEETLKKLG